MTLQQRVLLKRIEIALGFILHEWQKTYIITGEFNPPGGRATGKTTAYCVRLALNDGSYFLKEVDNLRDENHGSSYPRWFRNKFLEIRDKLKSHGFKVCEIKSQQT